jgi:putative tRNA adenosine deaminase-associated protein
MPYFLAVVARSGDRWTITDEDLDTEDVSACSAVDELADTLRAPVDDADVVLMVLEREDDWFALVRADPDASALVFVSDAAAARSSPYADALGLAPVTEDDEDAPPAPAGDLELLSDLGTDEATLLKLCGEDARTPADALAEVARRAGFEELLDALR